MKPQNSSHEKPVAAVQQRIQFYQGDVPHPEILAGLKEIDPSFPERIFKIAEAAAAERIRASKANTDNAREIVEKQYSFKARGQVLTFVLFLLILGVTLFLAYLGMSGAAIATCLGGFATIALSAINGINGKK